MSGWFRGILTVCHFTSRYNDMKTKNQTMASNVPTLLTVVIFTGVVVACISSFIPNFLATFFFFNAPEKSPTLTGVNGHRGETSIVLRVRQKIPINPDLKGEALAALHLAMDMQAQGKTDKALKLFQHALNLDPLHADILNAYGEFLERHGSDIILAEHMYHKALIISPSHDKALENIKRALPVVEELDQARFSSIDKKRDSLYKVPDSHPGLRRAKKEAYFRHIYHMNAIEGNTLTLSQTRSIIETRMAVGGKSLFEQNEVLGLDAALSFINNTLLGRIGSISMSDLLAIHKRVLGFVDPTEAGQLRTTQVYVGEFEPPPPQEVEKLMQDFLEWLNSEEAMNLHPVEFAALAHYKLVVIHPFYDGNGRTSRLLMNLILMQAGFPPVTIKIEERQIYYDTLETANVGDVRPFVRFIATCTERTIEEFLFATIENPDPSILRLSNVSSQSERVIIIDNP